jgi:hypothetical protein
MHLMPRNCSRPGELPPTDPNVVSVTRYDANGRAVWSWRHPDFAVADYLDLSGGHPVPDPPPGVGPDPDDPAEPFLVGG